MEILLTNKKINNKHMTPRQFVQKYLDVSDVHYPDMLINTKMVEDIIEEYAAIKQREFKGYLENISGNTCTSTELPDFSPNPNMID